MRTQNRPEGRQAHRNRQEDRDFHRDEVEYHFGDRNNQEDWENFAADRDRFMTNGNEQIRDSRRRGYQNSRKNR